MTNAEKARELCKLYQDNRASLFQHLLAMAQWKDEQVKQIVKDYIDLAHSNGQETNLLEDILKEL